MNESKLLELNTKVFSSPQNKTSSIKQFLHDISSPLQTLKIIESGRLCKKYDKSEIERRCFERIHELSKLTESDNEEGTEQHYICIPNFLRSICDQKTLELNIKISLKMKLKNPWTTISISKNELSEILSNLINNARDAGLPSSTIRILVNNNHLGTSISITDKGLGITNKNLIKLGNFGESSKSGGLGIGLASSIKKIRKINGHLTCRTIPNLGTQISLFLPY